jgi:hypothetical protein
MPEQPEQVEPAESADSVAVEVAVPVESTDAPARVFVADQALLDSVDLARRALLDVTPAETVGSVAGHLVEDEHVLTLLFAADLPGYPGWHWSVTIARVDDGEPTVLETELMPGETALLAPEWVPWSERMADYRAAQEAAAAAGATEGEAGDEEDLGGEDDEIDEDVVDDEIDDDEIDDEIDDDEIDDDEDEADLDDEAELDAAFGHDAGDDAFDGIDIDALDDSGDEDDDDDDEDEADEADEGATDDAGDEAGTDDADDDAEDETDDDAQPAEPRS